MLYYKYYNMRWYNLVVSSILKKYPYYRIYILFASRMHSKTLQKECSYVIKKYFPFLFNKIEYNIYFFCCVRFRGPIKIYIPRLTLYTVTVV